MPVLPIDFSIVSNPNRAHLALIESWMLWPHDEAVRRDAYISAVVAQGLELKREGKLDHATLDELDIAAKAEPLSRMRELATKTPLQRGGLKRPPLECGLMAGNILIAAIQGKDKKGRRLLRSEIDKKLRKLFARQRGDNSSFVNTIWKHYRSVSHLWAAHIKYAESEPAHLVFPCELRDVGTFLRLSEEWCRVGESTKTDPRSPFTILRDGESVRVPEWMKFSKET
jgi:hypothetical protein